MKRFCCSSDPIKNLTNWERIFSKRISIKIFYSQYIKNSYNLMITLPNANNPAPSGKEIET